MRFRRTLFAALTVLACHKPAAKAKYPPAICHADAKPWAPGQQAFRDATADWGLDKIDATGVRISVADIDNDGWPDIIVRKVGAIPDQGPTAGVRSIWLLRNTGHHSFEDVTYSSGILQTRQSHTPEIGRPGEVYAFADVDNDGDLDAYSGLNTFQPDASVGETSEILLNDGKGHFSLGPDGGVRITNGRDNPGGASFTDFDNDGNIDLWVPESFPPSDQNAPQQNILYKGDGQGGFTNVTQDANLATMSWGVATYDQLNAGLGHSLTWSAAACDLNGDGFPELLAGSYGRAPNELEQAVPANGGVTYINRSVESGYAYDTDFAWQDNQFARCYCQSNPSDPECAGGLPPPLVVCGSGGWDPSTDTNKFRLGGDNATAVCADLDNDGHFDLVNTDIRHWWAGEGADMAEVLLNTGAADVTFTRPGRDSMSLVVPHDSDDWDEGIMTAAVFDFDNDGWPDMYLGGSDYPGNRGLLYHQKSKLQFEQVPIDQGIDLHRGHGVVAADFDRDGDLDLILGTNTARCSQTSYPDADTPCYDDPYIRFFENVSPPGNWIQLKLEGAPGTNRSAIGALVTVKAGGVTQSHQVEGGHGHFGMQDDLVQHFGLGTSCEADITIRWPNTNLETQSFTLPAGYRFHVLEGSDPTIVKN